MQWEGREESTNVEDRRSLGTKAAVIGGGGGLLILILALVFGVDPQKLADIVGQGPGQVQVEQPGNHQPRPVDPEEERMASFSKVIFHDTEVVWDEQFRRMGKR